MNPPDCPNCGAPIERALDLPYGWWEWQDGRYVRRTAAGPGQVDVAPWVCAACMGELRAFHPQDFAPEGTRPTTRVAR